MLIRPSNSDLVVNSVLCQVETYLNILDTCHSPRSDGIWSWGQEEDGVAKIFSNTKKEIVAEVFSAIS